MKDEEKWEAWRNANAEIQKPYGESVHKHIIWYQGVDRRKAFLDGLAEGRKEKCLEQNNDGTIRPCEVMKDNEQLKAYESHWEEIEEDAKVIAKENEQLKQQIEKMKNFYNCNHSSRALCPNEHNCKGCKDWELAE